MFDWVKGKLSRDSRAQTPEVSEVTIGEVEVSSFKQSGFTILPAELEAVLKEAGVTTRQVARNNTTADVCHSLAELMI